MAVRHVVRTSAGVVAGAAAAVGFDRLVRRFAPRHATRVDALGLVAAAAVYPALRSRGFRGASGVREVVGLGAYGVLGLAVVWRPASPLCRVVAGAWMSHALFDIAHDAGPDSRIPDWYPVCCAGFDIGLAALIWRRR
jgi:hypothetical protein